MTDDIPAVKQTVLREFREKHWSELESTMTVLTGIRDDAEASNKDRIEAGKAIARILGVLSADKASNRADPERSTNPKHKSDKELEDLLNEL